MQIAVEYVWLACLVMLLSVSRWYYWRGQYEALDRSRDWEVGALRKRVKANSRLLAGMESQLQQWQVWSRDTITDAFDDLADNCDDEPGDDTDSENDAETPDDGG